MINIGGGLCCTEWKAEYSDERLNVENVIETNIVDVCSERRMLFLEEEKRITGAGGYRFKEPGKSTRRSSGSIIHGAKWIISRAPLTYQFSIICC